MNDNNSKAATNNTATTGSDNQASATRAKLPSQDHAETQATETTTLSIAIPNATVRLIRIVAAASDSTVGKTIAALLAGAVEREMPGIIRGLQLK